MNSRLGVKQVEKLLHRGLMPGKSTPISDENPVRVAVEEHVRLSDQAAKAVDHLLGLPYRIQRVVRNRSPQALVQEASGRGEEARALFPVDRTVEQLRVHRVSRNSSLTHGLARECESSTFRPPSLISSKAVALCSFSRANHLAVPFLTTGDRDCSNDGNDREDRLHPSGPVAGVHFKGGPYPTPEKEHHPADDARQAGTKHCITIRTFHHSSRATNPTWTRRLS